MLAARAGARRVAFVRPAPFFFDAALRVVFLAVLRPGLRALFLAIRAHCLTQVTSDQMRGTLTFSIDVGFRSACARNAGRSRSDLKPTCTVSGEIARSTRDRIGF